MSREQIFGIALPEGSRVPDIVFFGCGILIVRDSDPASPTEYFGLYGLSGRATAFVAPALIGLVTTLTKSVRLGISPVIRLFLIRLILLLR